MFYNMKRPYIYLFSILISILLLSCTLKQNVTLNQNGSGSLSMKITLHQSFYNYLKSLSKDAAELSKKPEEKLFKLDLIKEQLDKLPGVKVQRIVSPTPLSLEMELTFTDINKLIKDTNNTAEGKALSKIFYLTQSDNKYRFVFNLNSQNFSQLTPLMPVKDNPIYEVLGPHPEDPISEAEYYDLAEFTIGEGASQMVKDSSIETTVNVQGQLISQQGGKKTPNGVSFIIPLIKFLAFNKPLHYSFEFSK